MRACACVHRADRQRHLTGRKKNGRGAFLLSVRRVRRIVFIGLEARGSWCVEAPQTEHRGPDAVPGQKARWRQRKWRHKQTIVRRNGGASPPSSASIHPPTGLILPHHEPTSLLQRTTGKLPDSPEARNQGFQNKTAGSWADTEPPPPSCKLGLKINVEAGY